MTCGVVDVVATAGRMADVCSDDSSLSIESLHAVCSQRDCVPGEIWRDVGTTPDCCCQ